MTDISTILALRLDLDRAKARLALLEWLIRHQGTHPAPTLNHHMTPASRDPEAIRRAALAEKGGE